MEPACALPLLRSMVGMKPAISKPDLGGGVSHPARYSGALLPIFVELLEEHDAGPRVLDPFAGTGGIHELQSGSRAFPSGTLFSSQRPGFETVGVELEPEWARVHPDTLCASALDLPFASDTFDAICTSPTYGNRLADHHNASDPHLRRSYTHDLGRKLTPGNSGAMQWGDEYRDFHVRAWNESARVLRPCGLFVLNVKDHIRKGLRQPVAEWHVTTLRRLGFTLLESVDVTTPQLRQGENASLRCPEQVFVLRGAA